MFTFFIERSKKYFCVLLSLKINSNFKFNFVTKKMGRYSIIDIEDELDALESSDSESDHNNDSNSEVS